MFYIQKVDFEFKIIEVYVEEDALILILLGKIRVSYWKGMGNHNDYRWQDESGLYSSSSYDRERNWDGLSSIPTRGINENTPKG